MKDLVAERRFGELFLEELGWDKAVFPALTVATSQGDVAVEAVASVEGIGTWVCRTDDLLSDADRAKVRSAVKNQSAAYLLIWAGTQRQIWETGAHNDAFLYMHNDAETDKQIVEVLAGLDLPLHLDGVSESYDHVTRALTDALPPQ